MREEVKEESWFLVVEASVGWGGGRWVGPVRVEVEESERY